MRIIIIIIKRIGVKSENKIFFLDKLKLFYSLVFQIDHLCAAVSMCRFVDQSCVALNYNKL